MRGCAILSLNVAKVEKALCLAKCRRVLAWHGRPESKNINNKINKLKFGRASTTLGFLYNFWLKYIPEKWKKRNNLVSFARVVVWIYRILQSLWHIFGDKNIAKNVSKSERSRQYLFLQQVCVKLKLFLTLRKSEKKFFS